jgi:hypothetical protein
VTGAEDPQRVLRDPEPISLSLTLLAAVASGMGVLYQRREHRRGQDRERAEVRDRLLKADRSLNRLDESYRSLISIYESSGLLEPGVAFVPGSTAMLVPPNVAQEARRVRSSAFSAGRDLEDALERLSSLLTDDEAIQINSSLGSMGQTFDRARRADDLSGFLLELGELIRTLSTAIYAVAEANNVPMSSSRLVLLDETMDALRARIAEGR